MKPNRIYIIGTIGSGKTTLAKKLSNKYHIPIYSLDNYYWTTKYTRKRNIKVRGNMIKTLSNKDKWIVEGVFVSWTGELFKRADVVLWLNIGNKEITRNIIKRNLENCSTC